MAEPIEVLILNAFIERLRKVNTAKDPTWLNHAYTVGYGPFVKDAEYKTPALFAEVAFWRDQAQSTKLRHEAELDVRVTGYINQTKEPGLAVLRLFHDMKRVVAEAEADRLGGLVLWVAPVEAEIATETFQQSGKGVVVMTARMLYRWTHN